MTTVGRALAVLVAGLPALAAAQPYDYLDYKMINTAANPFQYYVDNRVATPAGLAMSGVQTAAERAWDSWNAVTCATPKARFAGLTNGVVPDPANKYDLFSVTAAWIFNPSDPDLEDILGPGPNFVVSMAVPVATGGALRTCDIYLNGTVTWSLGPAVPSSAFDLQTVLTHEAGHCLGLGHNGALDEDVMLQAIAPGEVRHALGMTDVLSLCQRYPLAGNSAAPCLADGGCNAPDLKCLAQPVTNGISTSLCSRGCTTSSGTACEVPTSCQASPAFAPTFNGACLLPGPFVTQVGAPCVTNGTCGAPNSLCLDPVQQSTGTVLWEEGYCTQDCAPGQPPCPWGSECVDFGNSALRCLQSCRVGLSDCRGGYACVAVTSGSAVCMPACQVNADCADPANYDCRVCDGLCVAKQNPSGQIGDLCNVDEDCGPGQTCNNLYGGKQCTRQCSRGCAACPTGSSCNTTMGGLFCLRDCTGPGTCPSGLRCADTETGKGCLPACNSNGDCPVGLSCYQGECYAPVEDAGCTTLCNRPDAGKPIPPVTDAGTGGGGGSGGCGCQATPPGGLALVLLAWFSFFVGRRQAWRRR